MSLGRKKSSSPKKIKINAPPPIQQVNTALPTGLQISSRKTGTTVTNSFQLDPHTRYTVDAALSGLAKLSDELGSDSQSREASIRQTANNFFSRNKSAINEAANQARQQLGSDISRQYGGRYNSTFGNELLARQESARLQQIGEARQNADLLAEDLIQQDEASRINRFNVFQNYLNQLNSLATGSQSQGTQLIATEQNRASSLALQRANLLQKHYTDQAIQDRNLRQNALNGFLTLSSILL